MRLNLHLHLKQGVALLTEATEVLYGGAAGGGKSHLMRVAAILWCACIPGLQVYLGQNLAAGQFANTAQAQAFGQAQAQNAAYNAAQAQGFGQGQAQGQFANAAAAQQFGQGLQGMQAANQAAAQQYAQNQGQAAFANAAQGQANSQNQAQAGFYNTAQQQAFGQSQSNAQLWNAAAQQAFQNQTYAQQLPINELDALMSSGQVALPQTGQFASTSVAPTDVTGAYALQQQALQADYAAQMQNYQSGLGGLFNLGKAVIGQIPFGGG